MIKALRTVFGAVAARTVAATKALVLGPGVVLHSMFSGYGLAGWGSYSFGALVRLARANPYAGPALRIVWQLAAEVAVVVRRGDGPAAEALPEHPMVALLMRPGGARQRNRTWRTLVHAFVWGVYCGGELFIERTAPSTGPNAGRALSLRWWHRDRLVDIRRDDAGEPTSYVFAGYRGRRVEVAAEDVLHVVVPDPCADPGEERGLPLLVAAHRALVQVEEADTWNRNISKGGGRVPGYFVPQNLGDGQTLTKDQVEAAQSQADEATTQRRQANLPQVLSGGFRYERSGVSPREADWLKGRAVSAREVCAVIGVSPRLLADEKGGSLTDAGVDSEVRACYALTVIPLLEWFLEQLSAFLLPDGERFVAETSAIAVLAEDVSQRFEAYVEAVTGGLLTAAEARTDLGRGAEPDEGMGELRVPAVAPERPTPEPVGDPTLPPDESAVVRYLRGLPPEMWDPEAVAQRMAA
ncbi:MAG: phage portal protein [Bacteroidota bacterium]